uniref:Uncharacterized protein n=1 Tax=Arcella intermedia TaxID=1963864 RepID=A0A6B2LWR3_9EUKA
MNLSCPAVSQIWSLTVVPPRSSVRILKSTPIVLMNDSMKVLSTNRRSKLDFPAPVFPINMNFIRKS